MREWSFWEWVAYATLFIGAAILAIDAGLKLTSLAEKASGILESPVWAFLPLFCVFAGTTLLLAKEYGLIGHTNSANAGAPSAFAIWPSPYAPTAIVAKRFRNEKVLLDGFSYSNCDFVNVTFVYNGTTPIQLVDNRITGAFFTSENPAVLGALIAAKGLGFLSEDIPFELSSGNTVFPPRRMEQPTNPPTAPLPSPAPPK